MDVGTTDLKWKKTSTFVVLNNHFFILFVTELSSVFVTESTTFYLKQHEKDRQCTYCGEFVK
jgi:hypothetical protein